MMNPAAVLHGINDLRYEDFPIAAHPGEGMVRVEMKAVGICGSDVSLFALHSLTSAQALVWRPGRQDSPLHLPNACPIVPGQQSCSRLCDAAGPLLEEGLHLLTQRWGRTCRARSGNQHFTRDV